MTMTTTLTMTYPMADDEIEKDNHRQPPKALCSKGFTVLPDYPDDECWVWWPENICADGVQESHPTCFYRRHR